MLSLLWVQVAAGVTLAVTVTEILVGLVRRRRPTAPLRVVARKHPPLWTEVVWVLGTGVAVFWPVGAFVLPGYSYHWPPIPDFAGSSAVQILGAALGVGGGFLFAKAAQALGTQMTALIQLQEGHELRKNGPYRYIRHPVYTAIMAIAFGQALLFLSPLAALLLPVLVGLAIYRSGLEESLLRSPEAFGATYDAYMARTGRFLPRLRSRT